MAIIYNLLADFEKVWESVFKLINENLTLANNFFNEFFKIYKSIGPAIMSNVAMVFLSQNCHVDLINNIKKILEGPEMTENGLNTISLSIEIISKFCCVTWKGAVRIFGEEIENEAKERFKFVEVIIKCYELENSSTKNPLKN